MADSLQAAKADLQPKGDEAFQSVLDSAMADPEISAIAAEVNDGGNAHDEPEPAPVVEAPPAVVPEPEPVAPPVAEPPAEPEKPQTDTAAPVAAGAVVDPLADTAPLDYGQGKSFDAVLLDKTNGGAFVLPDKIPVVQARLQEADALREQAGQLAQRVQHYDGLTYKTTGIDGGPAQEFRGVDAFVRAQADAAALAKGTLVLMEQIEASFPGEQFAQARKDLYDRMQFEIRKTAFDTGNSLRSRVQATEQQIVSQATQGQQEAQTFERAIAQIGKALPALTPQDVEAGRQFFAKRPQLLYRVATVQDAQQYGVRTGERIFDPTPMNEWYSERAALRAETKQQESARATAASAANKHNAAMEQGRQPAPKPTRAQTKSAPPAAIIPEKASRREPWANLLTDALQEQGLSG